MLHNLQEQKKVTQSIDQKVC